MPQPSLLVKGNALNFNGSIYRCAVGSAGFAQDKKEGDKKTPTGMFLLRECWYRADRIAAPATKLPLKIIQPDDGWCDDPKDENYNRAVKLPYLANHEKLWREDRVYDLIVPLGYNDAPVVAGRGSAIFMHVAKPDYSPTEGCVALAINDLYEVIKTVSSITQIVIEEY